MESNTKDLISREALRKLLSLLNVIPDSDESVRTASNDERLSDTDIHSSDFSFMGLRGDELEFWFLDVILVLFEFDFVDEVCAG